MSRDLPAELETAIDEPVVRPFLTLRIDLPDPVYVWTGRGNLIYDDADGVERTWLGAGDVGAIDAVGEATDGSATGIRASLLNVPSEFRDDIAEQAVRGVKYDIGVGALNEAYQVVEGLKWLNRYKLDDYKITDGGATLSVEVVGESRSIDKGRPAIKRFTDEYQQRKYPGDKFFEYVARMTEVSILWAQSSQNSTIFGGGGSVLGAAVNIARNR